MCLVLLYSIAAFLILNLSFFGFEGPPSSIEPTLPRSTSTTTTPIWEVETTTTEAAPISAATTISTTTTSSTAASAAPASDTVAVTSTPLQTVDELLSVDATPTTQTTTTATSGDPDPDWDAPLASGSVTTPKSPRFAERPSSTALPVAASPDKPFVWLDARAWDKQAGCAPLAPPPGGEVRCPGLPRGVYPVGAQCSLRCPRGYHLSGPLTRVCLPSGQWSAPSASCVGTAPHPSAV